jgi:hypothetical protein
VYNISQMNIAWYNRIIASKWIHNIPDKLLWKFFSNRTMRYLVAKNIMYKDGDNHENF